MFLEYEKKLYLSFLCKFILVVFRDGKMEEERSQIDTAALSEEAKIEIQKFNGNKNWLGGYKHKVNETGNL